MTKPIPDTDPLKREPPGATSKVSEKDRAEDGRVSPSEQGDDLDARVNEPYGPGQYRSGVDKPGEPTQKNPGHTNPAHNTPGHERGDRPDRPSGSTQAQPASYPGIRGSKARQLAEESKPPTEPASEKHPETIHPRDRSKP